MTYSRMLDAIDRFAARCGRPAQSPSGALAIWGTVIVLLFLVRAYLFTGTGADDAEQLVHMQSWAFGYGARNPPLFTWLVKLVEPLFGASIAAVVFLKFALLAGCLFLIYRAAEIVLADRSLAALAALSPIAFYYVSWDASFHYTHSVMLAFAISLTFYQLLLVERRRDLASYILFGVGLGFGLLSKYNYLIFLAALAIAVVIEREMRRILLDRRMLLAAVIGLLLAAPHFLWLWRQRAWLSALAQDRFNPDGPASGVLSLSGVGGTLGAAISFLLPLALFCIVLFPRAWTRAGAAAIPNARYRRVLDALLIGIVALTVVGVVAFGAARVRNHYMFLLILFPIAFLARAQAAGASARARNLFATTLLAVAILVPTAVGIKYLIDPLRSGKGYYHVPYAAFARDLRAAGFTRGTILGDWFGYPLAGNFRPYFPDARIINLLDWQHLRSPDRDELKHLLPPSPGGTDGQCLMVWIPTDGERRKDVVRKANALLGVELPADVEPRYSTAELLNGRGRALRIGYILLSDGSGDCR